MRDTGDEGKRGEDDRDGASESPQDIKSFSLNVRSETRSVKKIVSGLAINMRKSERITPTLMTGTICEGNT